MTAGSNVTPRIFVIGDQSDYRQLLNHHLTTHFPDGVVSLYDPQESGRLPDDFSGAGNDLVLLCDPTQNDQVLDWLRQFRLIPRFPPIVLIGSGDERQIVEAMKAGAAEYLSKDKLTHQLFIDLIEPLLEEEADFTASGQYFLHQAVLDAAGLPSLRGYEIRRRITMNEVSAIYLARDSGTNKNIVLKILRQMPDGSSEKAFDRFLQEYELIARIDHPNIVSIFDLGIADDHAYIAMEYCGNGSLKRRIKQGMESSRAFLLMRQIASALGELHKAGITHRDLKPTNIMFRDDESLVLIDFGLAKQAHLNAEITGTGEIFGTPYYMSPEQGRAGEVDTRGDIYSLGIIFYEMLTGQKPFEGGTAMSVIMQHREAQVPHLPAELTRFQPALDRMLAKNPDDRFQSADDLLAWLPADDSSASAAV
ncbi:MAG: protein kinase [Gammaproteobacteria bacterium]|nr:protein kinase [Gammaproteobacteria bacterium]